uniref:Cytosol aminopeptidase n=1 Tax=Lygus hesperus TaxID=30085 RepID=A0A0A9YUC0_LYGHE
MSNERMLNCADTNEFTGLVLGQYANQTENHGLSTSCTDALLKYDKITNGKISELLKLSPTPHLGDVRVFYGVEPRFSAVAVVGMGEECVGYNDLEELDEWKEAIRTGAAAGSRALQDLNMRTIFVESFGHAESAAEGSALGVWIYQELKNPAHQKTIPRLELYDSCDYTGWQIGLQKAAAQNLARQLSETPANLLTPIAFAQAAVEVLCKAGVSVEVKVRNWSKIMRMEAFLMSARGSCEPPIFLETSYYGCDPDVSPIVLVGKGTTFDSGGLCLKNCPELKHMRGEMSGAAIVVAVCRAASALQLPINIRGLIPLYENLPGSCAMKPGDIIRARNGKTILIETTDDGRMALADALVYSGIYNPKFILDIGSLSKEIVNLLGSAATGVFSNNDSLFENMRIAGMHTGDRVWRLPLWDHYTEKVTTQPFADVQDHLLHKHVTGVTCAAAAFLKQFIPNVDWIHLDTTGTNISTGSCYVRKGMSGRPTRTIVEFLAQLACISKNEDETIGKECLNQGSSS